MRLPELIVLGLFVWFVARVVLSLGGSPLYCVTCGTTGRPKRVTRGSLLIELVLWLCFIVPGLIYSLWRLSTRHTACRDLRLRADHPAVVAPRCRRSAAPWRAAAASAAAEAISRPPQLTQQAPQVGRVAERALARPPLQLLQVVLGLGNDGAERGGIKDRRHGQVLLRTADGRRHRPA